MSPRPSEHPAPTLLGLLVRPISDPEFMKFQALILRETGIFLVPEKKQLLMGRLQKRIRELGLGSFGAYYQRVANPTDAAERQRMIDLISTNETRFFREAAHFSFLERNVFPDWKQKAAAGRRPARVRVWSAACATGEEPYSLAMLLKQQLVDACGFAVEIIASDVSDRALERARAAVYPMERIQEIPQEFVHAFMLRGVNSQHGNIKIAPEIRSLVHFTRLNLNDDNYSIAAPFDLIFVRNVFIYFDAAGKARAIDRILDRLAPDGYLFLGRSESLHGITDRVRGVEPAVYALDGRTGSGSRRPRSSR